MPDGGNFGVHHAQADSQDVHMEHGYLGPSVEHGEEFKLCEIVWSIL